MTQIAQKKEQAKQQFEQLPMPREKDEAWRYTYIDRFKLDKFPVKKDVSIGLTEVPQELKKKGVILCPIGKAVEKHTGLVQEHFLANAEQLDKFLALAAGDWQDGFFLYVPKDVDCANPLKANIAFTGNTALYNLVVVEEGSKVEFLEEYSADTEDEIMHAGLTEVHIKQSATADYYHLNHYKDTTNSFAHIIGSVQKDARLNWISGCFGGKINRLRIDTFFKGEGAHSDNLGMFIGRKKQHVDLTTNAYHTVPNTTSDMHIDGIATEKSTSVYRGLIKIARGAQKTHSFLEHNALKLSETALANNIPALEIDADDVKASHGATIGQIDEEQLFYLMSRGLDREQAETLVVEGFFEPLIGKIPSKSVQEHFRSVVHKKE